VHRADDTQGDICLYLRRRSLLLHQSSGRPRFHKHGVGRHCDSRRDPMVSCLVEDVAEPRQNWLLLIGDSVVTALPPYGSLRFANPSRSKSYSILVDDTHPAWHSRTNEFDGNVLGFLKHAWVGTGAYKFWRKIILLSSSRTITLSRVYVCSVITLVAGPQVGAFYQAFTNNLSFTPRFYIGFIFFYFS